jgi:hypothetical protein
MVRSISALMTLCCLLAAMAVPAFASGGSSFVVKSVYLGPSDASRMSSARADANRLLSLAWFPAGARKLSTWIHLKGFELSEPDASIGDPDQIDIARFYLAGPKSQGVSWLNARTPEGGSSEGSGGTDRANLEWSYAFPFTPILPQSDLQYSKRILPDGNVEFRIDAQVAWTPQKSRFSIVPSGATLVEAVYVPGSGQTYPVSKRLTASTTSVETIATIRRQIDALPVAYPGIVSCPYETPGSITVHFFDAAHVRAFATAYFASSSCGDVRISQFSSTHRFLGSGDDGGGYDAVPSVMKLLGLKNAL